jgi:Flp pilus assembly protein TadD
MRAVEGGTVPLAWSVAAGRGTTPQAGLDAHWLGAFANPTGVASPWLQVATALLESGRPVDGFAIACRGMTAATQKERAAAIAALAPTWKAAGLAVPLDGDVAFDAGLAAASEDRLHVAVQHLRWAAALEPGNAKRAQSLAVALGRIGQGHEAIRVLAQHERNDAPRLIGRVLLESGRDVDAVAILRYASRRFRAVEDWSMLATAAFRADNDAVCIDAGRKAVKLGATDPMLFSALATSLYRLGEFVECEEIARQIMSESSSRDARLVGLHAMARALAGQGRHVDAHPYAKAAAELQPNGEVAADLIETMDRIVAQETPPVASSPEDSMERAAYDDLEAGRFESIVTALTSPSWGIARVALAACEFRNDDESGIPVAPRALDAAVAILGRTEGTTDPEAALARIRALRIRDNAFIQIDPPPPLGLRYSVEEFERAYAERDRRPHRPSAIMSFAR